jgi:hypothetical protein
MCEKLNWTAFDLSILASSFLKGKHPQVVQLILVHQLLSEASISQQNLAL